MTKDAKWAIEGELTDAVIAKQRERIGWKMRIPGSRGHDACRDNVTAFANAIGDSNPLYRDEEYAEKTRWGARLAPPTFFNIVTTGEVMHGMPGVQAYHCQTRLEFLKPIYVGDTLRAEPTFVDMVEKKSGFSDRWFIEKYETNFYNQNDELILKNYAGMVRVARSGQKKSGQDAKVVVPHPWTEAEVVKLEDEMVKSDVLRGGQTRYWEDTSEGEELPTLVIGPLRMVDVMAWTMCTSMIFTRGVQVGMRELQKHRGLGMFHPESNAHEWIPIVHWDNIAGRTTGLPGAYDFGAERHAYQIHQLTNWMGDDAYLKMSDCQYRKFVFIGDALYFKGEVVKKYADENGEHCVDIETHVINQRNDDTMPGTHTVVLPSRAGAHPADSRARKS